MERDSQEIRLCALVLSVVAFFLFIAAEIVHEQHSAPSRGVLLLVAIGALAFAWIGPLTLLAGTLRSKKFQWWQPFQGGAEFVWMQAYGWCFHTFVLSGCVVVLANPQVPKWFEGQYLLLGAMGFMAQLLLNLSIGCFRDVADVELPAFEFPFTTKAVVSLLVSASGTLMFVCYDLFSHRGQSPVMVALGCLEFIVSALVIHVLYGCADIPGFRIWQPFDGESTFLLLQYLGWQLFAFTVGGALSIFFRATDDLNIGSSSRGSGTAIGAMGMTSQLLLLASLQYFDGSSSTTDSSNTRDGATTAHNSTESRRGEHHHARPVRGRQWRYPAEIYVASLLCIGALGIGCATYICASKRAVVPEPLLRFVLTHEKVGWIIALLSLAIAAPIANMGGVRAKAAYGWWQPFEGGTKFVFLQTLGWLWYGFYLALAIVLCMNSASCGELAAGLVLVVGAGSAGAIAASLAYFEPSSTASTELLQSTVAQSAHWWDAIKGEVTMVLLLALVSTLIHCGVDYFRMQLLPLLRTYCLVLAMALFVLACAISHGTGWKRSPQFRMWQPFEGGDRFVVRQAVGWALVGVQLLFDSLQLTLVPQTVPFGVLSLLGAFTLVPTLVILSSIQHFDPTTSRRDSLRHAAADSELQSLLSAHTKCRDWATLMQDATLWWHTRSNVLVVASSACLFIAAEILGTAESSYQHAEEVLYLFGCLLSTFGIAFTHGILGPKVHATYRVFQPFRGGIQFITFHGVAWTLVAVALSVSTTVMYWSALFFEIPGIHLLTGLLYVVSQSLLLYSVPLFKPTTDERAAALVRANQQQHLKADEELAANQFFVGRLLGFSACAVFVLVDLAIVRWGPSIPVFPMSVSAVLALFSSIPMSYKFASSHYGSRAKTLSGSIVFVVLGCALWSFTLLLGGLFSYNLWRTQNISLSVTSMHAPTQYLGSFTGSVGFTAQLLFFQASESSPLKDDAFGVARPHQEKLAAIAATAKKHLAIASIWVYSAVPVVAGLLYAHTKSVLPKHVATSQILVLALCSAAVIGVAWWIQQQIVSTGYVGLPLSRAATPLRALPHTLVSTESLAASTALADIGIDCYAHIAALLTVSELVVVSSTSRALYVLHSERFWRQLFIDRFIPSASQRLERHTSAASLRTKVAANVHSAVTIRVGACPFAATTLNRVESAVVNAVCRLDVLPSDSPPKRARVTIQSKWKAFCVGGERQFAFEHCHVCNEIDAVSETLLRYERRERCATRTPTTWVALCDCVNPVTLRREKAHRACLERKLLLPRCTPRALPSLTGTTTSTTRTTPETPAPQALETCRVCDVAVVASDRLPRTLGELVRATIADFRSTREDFGGGFFVLVPASASIFIVALHRVGWGSCAMYVWVVTIVALCFIINSPRFDRCLARLGQPESPSFVAYQRAYQALALSSIVHLSWCCPSMNQFELAPAPTLAQRAVKLAFRCNCMCFVALAVAACLAFWRTQYRVATVHAAAGMSSVTGEGAPTGNATTATADATADRNIHGAVADRNIHGAVADRTDDDDDGGVTEQARPVGTTAAAAVETTDSAVEEGEGCVLCLLQLCDDTLE